MISKMYHRRKRESVTSSKNAKDVVQGKFEKEKAVEIKTSERLLTLLELIEFPYKVFETNNKVGIPQLSEEKRRRSTTADFANFAEVSGTKDSKERTKSTVWIDKLKEIGKVDIKN